MGKARNYAIFLVLLTVVTSADDIDYLALLIGTWGYLQKEDGSYWGYDEYFADGTVHAWGVNPETNKSWEIWGTVEIEGNISCSTTIQSSDPEVIPVGLKVCDEIVSIDAGSLIWRHQDGNMTMVDRIEDK